MCWRGVLIILEQMYKAESVIKCEKVRIDGSVLSVCHYGVNNPMNEETIRENVCQALLRRRRYWVVIKVIFTNFVSCRYDIRREFHPIQK